jgi:hypothetical protein
MMRVRENGSVIRTSWGYLPRSLPNSCPRGRSDNWGDIYCPYYRQCLREEELNQALAEGERK